MKVILFKKQNIKSSKDGAEYVKVSALSEKGEVFEIFSNKADYENHKVGDDKYLNDADVAELFTQYATVDVQFNNRGRLESIS